MHQASVTTRSTDSAATGSRLPDTQLVHRRAIVAANVTGPLPVCEVGPYLGVSDVMEQGAFDERVVLTRHRPRRCRRGPRRACLRVSPVEPALNRDVEHPGLVDPAILLERRAVGVSNVTARDLLVRAIRQRTTEEPVDAAFDTGGG